MSGTSGLVVVLLASALVWVHGWFVGRRMRATRVPGTLDGPADLHAVSAALDAVRSQVRDLDRQRAGADVELLARVRDIERSTRELGTALRTPRTRGRWGELHLRRAVELAGMSEHCDFVEQGTHHDDADDARLRPDMVVRLAGGRTLVIDAKAPMEAWLEALDCADEAERSELERRHAACVREHVRSLSRRGYARSVRGSAPVVVLYLPGEDLLRAALEHDTGLLEYAARHDIALATPISLISILRGVAIGWQETRLADNAAQIASLGGRLCDRIGVVNDHLAKLGRSLDASVRAFDDTVGSVQTRLVPAARGLRELDSTGLRPPLQVVQPIDRFVRTQEQQ